METKNKYQYILQWVMVLAFFGASSFLASLNASDLKVSVIPTKQAPAFDGLVPPIEKVPNWTALKAEEYKLAYNQMPADKLVPLPTYDPNQLKTPTEQLGWKSAADLATRNAKITFPTPYMGSYRGNGLEYDGSHLAIDIKMPTNTRVNNIGNGVVVKVANQQSGFGVHVVVEHDNFPSFSNQNVKATYFSSYNHLGSAIVSEGDIVLKGQQIGWSGSTGSSTTPHLHFQIDNDQAPWHPYWPYTYQESQAAGVSWSEAIDIKLNQDKAIATTINPMAYIQKYQNTTNVAANVAPTPAPTPTAPVASPTQSPTPSPTATAPVASSTLNPTPAPIAATNPTASTLHGSADALPPPVILPVPVVSKPAKSFKIITKDAFVSNVAQTVTVQAVDENGEPVNVYESKSGIYLSLELGSATFNKNSFASSDFTEGRVTTTVIPSGTTSLRFKATDGEISGLSDLIPGKPFTDISSDGEIAKALEFLKNYQVLNGYTDGTFRGKNIVTRAEIVKIVANASNMPLMKITKATKAPFKDIDLTQWYGAPLFTAYRNKLINGYKDGTFRPTQSVTKAEFMKMLFIALKIQTPSVVAENVFNDVTKNYWAAGYVAYAKESNIINEGTLFKPDQAITREEVAEITYKILALRLSGQKQYSNTVAISGSQAQEYFAKHGG